ncbi:MAG: Gfo/Idh/MocA family oxidoreductase [Verrucomicrobiota bacterium]|nr:Gfo/Idh/MocA family oxidoreductase [Verrucomicrobiota bacterium]
MSTDTKPASEYGVPVAFPRPRKTDWKIGFIGFGGIAQNHLAAYRAAGWSVVAIADPSESARERATQQGIPRVYADYREMLVDPAIDVVVLLTQPNLRVEPIEHALRAGKPVLTEKPLAATWDEAVQVAELSAKYRLPVAVSQNYRWIATPFAVRHLIEQNWIGKPFFGQIELYGTQDIDLREHGFYSKCEDFLTLQWNNHLADLLRCWFGAEPQRVQAITRRRAGQHFVSGNLLLSTIDYGPGLTGHIVHSELLCAGMPSNHCRIDGDNGSLVFPLWGNSIQLTSKRLADGPVSLVVDGPDFAHTQIGTLGDLLCAIEDKREPLLSARNNLATLSHVFAEHASTLSEGQWVSCK